MSKALIFFGGFPGHEPEKVADWFERILMKRGYEVKVTDNLGCLDNQEEMMKYQLIVPCYNMGELSEERTLCLMKLVSEGVSVIGIHGMCDAFRGNIKWQLLTGGQFVGHPLGKKTLHNIYINKDKVKELEDFQICTEQYYMLVDPGVTVLAWSCFKPESHIYFSNVDKEIHMPVCWEKKFGKGTVYYCSLGHNMEVIEKYSQINGLIEYGLNLIERRRHI